MCNPFKALLISIPFLAVCLNIPATVFAENDQDVVNRLYQEIINTSRIQMDTTDPNEKQNDASTSQSDSISVRLQSGEQPGSSSERLEKQIEMIRKDIELRHSETVKFMQDDK